jgi:hypothetical protein
VLSEEPGQFMPVTGGESAPVILSEGDLIEVDAIAPGQTIVSGIEPATVASPTGHHAAGEQGHPR